MRLGWIEQLQRFRLHQLEQVHALCEQLRCNLVSEAHRITTRRNDQHVDHVSAANLQNDVARLHSGNLGGAVLDPNLFTARDKILKS